MANPFTAKAAGFMPTDYDTEAQQIERNRKYAEMLQSQAMQQENPNQMVGDRVVRYSPLQGLAKMLQAYGSVKMQEQADQRQADLVQRQQADFTDTAQKYASALRGTDAQLKDMPQGQEGPPELIASAVPGSRDAALQVAMQSKSPMWQQTGMQMAMKDMEPGKYGNTVHYDQSGKAFVNNEKGEIKYLGGIQARDKIIADNLGGTTQYRTEYSAQPVGQAFHNDPNKPFALTPNGMAPNTPLQNYEMGKAKAGAANVSVNTATKPMLNELGKGVGEKIIGDFTAAQQAQQTLNNVQQIRSGLGNVIAGPGANTRVTLAQVGEVLGVNGKDTTEKLQNTRNLMQGLARQELAAAGQMKGQGQITESERTILRKAESGQINELTVPEINTLLGALEKTAGYRINNHSSNLERLKRDPNAAGVVDYMTLPGAASPTPQQGRNITVDY